MRWKVLKLRGRKKNIRLLEEEENELAARE